MLRPAALRVFALAVVSAWLGCPPPARAGSEDATGSDSPAGSPDEGKRDFSREEIEAWLDSNAVQADIQDTGAEEPSPPPAPQHRGLVLEGGLGAFGHLGEMRYVSPTAPMFHFQLGYEVLDSLMLFGEFDMVFGTTSFARRPPDPRGYTLFGGGGGLRFTVRPLDRLGIYAQGSIGAAKVDEDVLAVYGFRHADNLNPYYAALLGLEWYQVNPHTALTVHGGIRNYPQGFDRERSTATPLAWTAGTSLRYAF